MDPIKRKHKLRQRRHRRLRKKLEGTPERPRLCVFRSNKHIYAQVVDDWDARTLLSASTLSPALRERIENTRTTQAASAVGEFIGRQCLEKGISKVVFDRGGYRYHGRVKALAEEARKQFKEAGQEGF